MAFVLGGTASSAFRDVAPTRPRWADLQDSSQEIATDSPPQPPLSQSSYKAVSQDTPDDGPRAGLRGKLEATVLELEDVDSPSQGSSVAGEPAKCPQPNVVEPCRSLLAEVAEPHGAEPTQPDPDEACSAAGAVAPGSGPGGASTGALAPLSWRLRAWKSRFTEPAVAPRCAQAPGAEPRSGSPPLRTPVRRRRQSELDPTPLGKRARGPAVQPMPEASKDEWQRRLQKRRNSVAAIKGMPEYHTCAAERAQGTIAEEDMPLTPEPDDCTVSKRQWEGSVMRWRAQLRQLAWQEHNDGLQSWN
eukprot:CAMPEP_0168422298 /NCGR_PEP_ID=MMETSP0228-20121227/33723_1 /TAXON_ID=133427 /ORGANISM="Protoceratium reticulatum, Strain CCCM 535 (=CCMP 1889)" /LENGTH=302 /DNA_ID=CAMNT_0008436229 /DNA_START=58 /DNA_END=966 /DNA_ORIENTATION=-